FVFILVVGALLAAIPLSAVASESFLSNSVRQAEVAFNQSLSAAVGGGLQRAEADSLMWRYSQVQAVKPSAWWQVPVADHTKLDSRLAALRGARAQVDAAAQNARTLLANAGQYPQLSIAGFHDQITTATAGLDSVHSAEAFAPILARLQQTAAGIQGLLNARAGAYNQLADTRSTLATAQRIGAIVGNRAGVINALAGQLGTAADQGAFQSLTSQLYQQKQALSSAIFTKQMSPVSYNAGAGKLIVISLSRQVLTAYQDGAVVL